MFKKITSKYRLIVGFLLILLPVVVFAALPLDAVCAFHSSSASGSGACGANFVPSGSVRIRSAVISIIFYLYPVVIAFTLAFLLIKLFKKAAKKASK